MTETSEADEVGKKIIAEFRRNGGDFGRAITTVLVRRIIKDAIYRILYRVRLIELLRRRYDLPPRREEAAR